MANFPPDRFDNVPADLQRVGAHRAPKKQGSGWMAFAWAVAAVIILTGSGILGIAAIKNNINFDFLSGSPSASPTLKPSPTAEPTLAPDVPLTILNGTATVGLATQVGDALVAAGWKGASEGVGSRANASATDVAKTTIYYADPSLEGAARGLVLALRVGEVRLSTDFPGSKITVVIDADYKPAG